MRGLQVCFSIYYSPSEDTGNLFAVTLFHDGLVSNKETTLSEMADLFYQVTVSNMQKWFLIHQKKRQTNLIEFIFRK